MININNLTTDALRRAIEIQEQIEALQTEFSQLAGGYSVPLPSSTAEPSKKYKFSPAARAKMAKAQRDRWAKKRGDAPETDSSAKPKRKVSASARAAISAAAKKRWAAAKAAGKNQL